MVKIIFPGRTNRLLGVRRFLHVEDEETIMRLAGGKLGAACDGMPETFITIIYIMSNPMSHSQNTITFFIATVNMAMFPEIKNILYYPINQFSNKIEAEHRV